MALVIETEIYRHKENKDFIILVLQIDAEDEDYREPAFIYKHTDIDENWRAGFARTANFPSEQRGIRSCTGWKVSLNHNFLSDWEEIQDE